MGHPPTLFKEILFFVITSVRHQSGSAEGSSKLVANERQLASRYEKIGLFTHVESFDLC